MSRETFLLQRGGGAGAGRANVSKLPLGGAAGEKARNTCTVVRDLEKFAFLIVFRKNTKPRQRVFVTKHFAGLHFFFVHKHASHTRAFRTKLGSATERFKFLLVPETSGT